KTTHLFLLTRCPQIWLRRKPPTQPGTVTSPIVDTRSSVVSPKYLYIRCAQIGLGRGAREGVYPQGYSTDGATKPQANFSATRRAACLLGGGVVARSLQIHCGICSSLAPGLRPKSIAANV